MKRPDARLEWIGFILLLTTVLIAVDHWTFIAPSLEYLVHSLGTMGPGDRSSRHCPERFPAGSGDRDLRHSRDRRFRRLRPAIRARTPGP